MNRLKIALKMLLFLTATIFLINCGNNKAIKDWKADASGVVFSTAKGKLKITICSDKIINIIYSASDTFSTRKSLMVEKDIITPTKWENQETDSSFIISTAQIKVNISKTSGTISYYDKDGGLILKETEKGRNLEPAKVLGEQTYHAELKFDWFLDEALYGLGQHQDGIMNYRGHNITLVQDNTVDVVPTLVSTRGYGLLFDNYSQIEFKDKPDSLIQSNGKTRSGSVWAEVADEINYYFMYGPELDSVVASYRTITGTAPMFGKWAYGLWQCKEHYHTQQELMDVVKEFRKRKIPLDNIVQDWFYWNPLPWGSHNFDPLRYPSPSAMTKELHEKWNTKIMISVWAKFDPGSANHKELIDSGFLYGSSGVFGNSQFYDAFNENARKVYWKQMRDSIFNKGFDAWWLDATEPELGNLKTDSIKRLMNNALGTGARYLNAYSLMTTKGVYEGQRAETSDKRVFILTRSQYAGQQRYAGASWSGDIQGNWDVFRKQISGGLNMTYSGIPYWTTDIGGFFVTDYVGGNKNKEYQELFTRWYQFGAFCPLFRVHGTSTPREIYKFGDKGYWAYDTQLKFDNLRYRLLPYIYSLGWKITSEGYTMMRGLAFDFRTDPKVMNIDNQYMFGPSMLINPVTESMYYKDFLNYKNLSKLINSEYLLTNDNKTGFAAEYFNDEKFEKKALSRIDTSINFDWGIGTPDPSVNMEHFSVRWQGKIKAPESGEYVFLTNADDGTKLWINDKLLFEDWTQHAAEYRSGKITLEANKEYKVKLEYFEVIGGASIQLLWITPGIAVTNKKLNEGFNPDKTKIQQIYLPQSKGWYDFWTGEFFDAGKTIETPSPIEIMPIFIKSGSILPMGPFIEYSTQKPADPIELRIYEGTDCEFNIYEDENDNYNYEKGVYAIIPLKWDDKAKTLTIGQRKGEFPGMLKKRTFNIVFVSKDHGTGVDVCQKIDKSVNYQGEKIEVKK